VRKENRKTELGEYADGMSEHDGQIGQVLDHLDKAGLTDNTIVLYTTDNGPMVCLWPDAGATPFRGEPAPAACVPPERPIASNDTEQGRAKNRRRHRADRVRDPPGKRKIEVATTIAKPGAPAEVVLAVDGNEVARTTVNRTVPAAFTASETFDVGVDLGSPVSMAYFDRRPFPFTGKISSVTVRLAAR